MSTYLPSKLGKPSSSPQVSEDNLIYVDGASQSPLHIRLTTPSLTEAIPSLTKSGRRGREEPIIGSATQPTLSANAEKGSTGRNGNLSFNGSGRERRKGHRSPSS
eukprot:GHVS01050979.1.p1 GENE.GHVS01050979.1~~GHVS01050979.1.p1  ORF type:complete len:105 (+),score=4.17 GHVS01050979.1:141-455(+)